MGTGSETKTELILLITVCCLLFTSTIIYGAANNTPKVGRKVHNATKDHYISRDYTQGNQTSGRSTPPRRLYTVETLADGFLRVPFVTISDMDSSLVDKVWNSGKWRQIWRSPQVRGYIKYKYNSDPRQNFAQDYSVTLGKPAEYEGKMAYGDRGLELSDLLVYNGRLYTVCDRTGIIYWMQGMKLVPWTVYADGDGSFEKPFKTEWMTIFKDGNMYTGGYGMEWLNDKRQVDVTTGHNPLYIKIITPDGAIKHVSWVKQFGALRRRLHRTFPKYIIHESAQWSHVHNQWFFLPRKISRYAFTDKINERMGGNALLRVDEFFKQIHPTLVRTDNRPAGKRDGTRGFSAFQFLPKTNDEVIVALKSVEMDGRPLETYITVFHISGKVFVRDMKITGNAKMEGIEFIDWTNKYWSAGQH